MIRDQEKLTEFITAWQSCTLDAVARMFDISKRDASAIATSLRASGIELRDQRRTGVSVDIAALAEVAREAAEQ